jgi:hypothetical protein
MKTIFRLLLPVFSVAVAGCASVVTPTRIRTIDVSYSPAVSHGDVIEAAIAVGRELNFPPATIIDKTVGMVNFGDFGKPILGITAQARVKSDGDLEVTVNRWSEIVPMSADAPAEQFKAKFEARMAESAKKDVK